MRKVLYSTPVSSPSTLNGALALEEAGLLGTYFTTVGFPEDGAVMRAARRWTPGLAAEVQRRAVIGIPREKVRTFPVLETARTALSRMRMDERRLEPFAKQARIAFDRHVAARLGDHPAIYAFNRTAVHSFREARRRGMYRIYGVKGPDPGQFARMLEAERIRHPSLAHIHGDLMAERSADLVEEWELADLVIANSQFTLDSFAEQGLDISKGRVATLGFPPPCPARELAARPPPNGPLKLLWAGTFSIRKGAHLLLMALQHLDPKRVSVRVFGKQVLPPAVLTAWPTQIEFHPTVPRAQLIGEYQSADLLVVPTLSDGFAMVISEAMSQGLPVVTTDKAGAADFIEHRRNGLLIPAADPDALAETLAWCVEERTALRAMGEAARATAEHWQWRDYRTRLADILRQALGGEVF